MLPCGTQIVGKSDWRLHPSTDLLIVLALTTRLSMFHSWSNMNFNHLCGQCYYYHYLKNEEAVVVAPASNPIYSGGRDRKDYGLGLTRTKVIGSLFQPTSKFSCLLLVTWDLALIAITTAMFSLSPPIPPTCQCRAGYPPCFPGTCVYSYCVVMTILWVDLYFLVLPHRERNLTASAFS
jgi:hypothetical protein